MSQLKNGLKKVYVVGSGMTKFEKPGRRENFDYPQMAKEATTKALDDCKLNFSNVEQACVGYVFGDSTCGQRAVYEMGMTGIPIYNVNNNCATGSTALFMAYQFIKGGISDCILALGFEKMSKGSLSSVFTDRTNPIENHVTTMAEVCGIEAAPMAVQLFGNAGIAHMEKYGSTERHMAKIGHKNHKHSINNPNAQFQTEYSLEQIEQAPKVFGPLTKLQCSPTSDGAAAAILASEEFVLKHNLQDTAVEIVGMEMATDLPSTFESKDPIKLIGYDMAKTAATKLYSNTGLTPDDVQVVECHDCFSANELITYEALGLCKEGEAHHMVDAGDNTYGGRFVVNPSGGLISKGHPLGATGLAQCNELCLQVRGLANKRQVPGAKVGLQHNIGLGGAAVVALYRLGFGNNNSANSSKMVSGDGFKSTEIFEMIEKSLKEDGKNLVPKVKGVYCFMVTGGPEGKGAKWIVDAKNGTGSVTKDGTAKSDVTITMTDSDLYDLMLGKLNSQKAFFQGKLKIKGNMGLAMKLQEFQKQAQKLQAKL